MLAKSGNLTGSALQATSLRRHLNVENATNALDAATAELREAIGELATTLGPVLAPERPSECGEKREPGASEVADRILDNSDVVRGATASIRRLIDRL